MPLIETPFVKMHGLGNDFVVLDLRADQDAAAVLRRPELARALADRRRGVGCDQVILIESDATADARLRFLNADGSEAGACGNGTRCAAALMIEGGDGPRLDFVTSFGSLWAERAADGRIRVDMGAPRFGWRDIPLSAAAPTEDLAETLAPALADFPELKPIKIGAASMGNPHCIIIVDDMNRVEVERIGAALEPHPLFPERANIGFVQVLAPDRLRYRVFERGAGVTEACGSGACAALAVTTRLGFCAPKATLQLDGGLLDIEQDAETGRIVMTGPAVAVFEGRLDPQLLEATDA
ncbi:MAG: diaminopimelate epimerase [Neomegalonema sp.]|nr:diaminopimelate epimerase [Neomegalonema sp.]